MFGKISKDDFPNIFELSIESEGCHRSNVPRSFDFLPRLSLSPLSNEEDLHDLFSGKDWKSNFLDQDQAFAKLSTDEESEEEKSVLGSKFFSDAFVIKASYLGDFAIEKPLTGSKSSCSTPDTSSKLNIQNSNTGGSSPSGKLNTSRYKTELCRPYQENGNCKYGEKCQFAHGMLELRAVNRHPKYKTDLCRTYHSIGFCPYGPRCHFIHSFDEVSNGSPRRGTKDCLPRSNNNITAAAISALRQLPILNPDGDYLAPPPGFNPILKPKKLVDSLVLRDIGGSESTSGFNSASSLSPNAELTFEESRSRLTVFSRLISN